MESINAATAEEITLNARDYEGRDDIYSLIQSAAKQGLSHITVIIKGKDESKFIADMENKGFLCAKVWVHSPGVQFNLYKKSIDYIVYDIRWVDYE